MANEPKINLALVDEMPENPVRGTVYMSPDTSGNFVKVGVDGSVRTIFDGSDYVRKDESVWIPGEGENSAVLANGYSYATGDDSVSHGFMTYARGLTSHAEGVGCFDYPISVYSDFSNNIIYGADNVAAAGIGSYIGLIVSYQDVYATIVDAYLDKKRGAVFVLDKPLAGFDFMEETEVYLLSGGVAAGECSHTEGDSTVAVGDRSHAEGFATYAGSMDSHAEGVGTATYGGGAHAEGDGTLATGDGSHAEGSSTTTSGHYSHAEGYSTRASGDYSHAEGRGQELLITINGPADTTHYTVKGGSLFYVKEGDTIRYRSLQKVKTVPLPYEKTNPDNGFTYAIITEVHMGKDQYIEVDNTLSERDAITDGDAYILQGVAEGYGSHSEGYYTNAVGDYSHSEGTGTRALSDYSHVEGVSAAASGVGSHSEGYYTNAVGDYSHAEGEDTMTSGYGSHAEGYGTTALADNSHAEGYGATALGTYSHAEGEDTMTSGYSSHAEGYGTTALDDNSHAEGTGTLTFGNGSHAEGEGNRIPLDGVEVYGQQNTTVYTTSSAHGLSVNDIIYVDYGTDEFANEVAKVVSVDTSTQFTVDNTLNPYVSLDASLAGTYVFYKLFGCTYGTHSHVEGVDTRTLADYSHAEGNGTTALGEYSHAEGNYTTALDDYSHAEGDNTSASGIYSHAEGENTEASGSYSHTEGERTTASATGSHAEGDGTNASGNYSHAEGNSTTASGDYSHAEGRYTSTSNAYEHAQGSYNMSHNYSNTFGNSGNTLDSIGVGVSDASRSNAIEVMQNGDVYVKGVGSYDGSNYVNASTLQEVVNSGGGGSVDSMISITYANLKNLRDTSTLIPGMQYRITDYECTTAQADTSIAGHVFDIIVTADSETELNENARAAYHSGDTYFQTCDLDAWELKYCLENDTDRFAWADATNGKGVVYYMKDEWSNECSYDFKNILFKRWEVTECVKCPSLVINNSENPYGLYYGAKNFSGENVIPDASYGSNSDWFYTFALKDISSGQWYDYSILNYLKLKNSESLTVSCQMNKMPYNIEIDAGNIKQYLNNIVFFNCVTNLLDEAHPVSSDCTRNIFSNACHSSTFGINCYDNIFGNQNYGNTAGRDFASNKAEAYCANNVFGNNIQCNSFDIYFAFNSIKDNALGNSFGKYCYNNVIGLSFETNTLGTYCYNNTFGDSTYSNTFGNEYCNNTAGMHMVFNFFQNRCNNNTFGVYFESNTVGNGCAHSSFGNYLLCCTFFNYITYCNITGGTSTSAPVRYLQILDGTKGADQNNRLTISLAVNKNYQQTAGLNSSGVLKIWTPADLID